MNNIGEMRRNCPDADSISEIDKLNLLAQFQITNPKISREIQMRAELCAFRVFKEALNELKTEGAAHE